MSHFAHRIAPTTAVALALAVACTSTIQAPKRTRQSTKEIVERSKPAIVRVEVKKKDGSGGVGTGFILSADGRIATNLHVIRGADQIAVTLLDGTVLPVAEVTALDLDRDLAIVSVDPKSKLPTLNLGDSDEVSAGDHIIAIGNPLGVLDHTVSDGLISSVRPLNPQLTILQISAPISQGSSGGPLFNHYGEVIGVATAIVTEGQNLNFGIPANYLRPLLESAKGSGMTTEQFAAQFEPAEPPPTQTGTPKREVPTHDFSVLDGCAEQTLIEAVQAIDGAIRNGAPLYNSGNHEACFRIYEGTAARLERELACPGLAKALGAGLLRASTLETYTEKAWALRDAFDGVVNVVLRKARQQP